MLETASHQSLEAQRHASLRSLLAASTQIEIGDAAQCLLPPGQLASTTRDSPYVLETHSGGLTAVVYRVHLNKQEYALKVRRPQALVHNFDGETSFLNELLRRQEIARLITQGRWPAAATLTPTRYASTQHGILLTPWVNGVAVNDWNARQLTQAFAAGAALIEAGMFEWDFSPGNMLDDGQAVWLFDLGYCYSFDPLTQFNTAGNGLDEPLFHLVERFETRNLSAQWLRVERERGLRAALDVFAQAKRCACICYEHLRERLAARGARARILSWLDALLNRWRVALADEAALYTQYLVDSWRSHLLDVEDDLRGRSCTPLTLQRVDWLERALAHHMQLLQDHDAFFWADKARAPAARTAHVRAMRAQAMQWQTGHARQSTEQAA